jgi:hypothetical protein
MTINVNLPLQLTDGTKVTYVGTTARGRIQVNIPGGDNNPYLFEQSGEHYKGEQLDLINTAGVDTTLPVTFRVNDVYYDDVSAAFVAFGKIIASGGTATVSKIETIKVITQMASYIG